MYNTQMGEGEDGSLPRCDSRKVLKLAESIFRDSPAIKLSGLQAKGVTSSGEVAYNPTREIRPAGPELLLKVVFYGFQAAIFTTLIPSSNFTCP